MCIFLYFNLNNLININDTASVKLAICKMKDFVNLSSIHISKEIGSLNSPLKMIQ